MFTGMWAGIKALRSVAYFGQAMNSGGTGDLRSKWKENKGNFRTRLALSGAIMASTVAISARSLWRAGSNHMKRRHEKQMAQEKTRQAEIQAQGQKDAAQAQQAEPVQAQVINPTDQSGQPMNPAGSVQQANGQSAPLYNPATQQVKEGDQDNPFAYDGPIGYRLMDLERDLIVMKLDPKSNQQFAVVETGSNEPNLYVTGSGIYNEVHQPYYKLGFERDKTFYLAQLLEKLNEHEYQDALTIFEMFEH